MKIVYRDNYIDIDINYIDIYLYVKEKKKQAL